MITFEQSDEIAKWASEHADELRRDAARSSPEAVRSMLSWLGKHPLLRRYVQHLRTIRKNTEPWCALGERLYAALMLLAAESDGSDGAARLGGGWVPGTAPGYAMLAAVGSVPYLWLNTVDELVRQTPLPQHTVSRTCLPYPCLFFSFETCFGNPATGETNWLLVKHQPDGRDLVRRIAMPERKVRKVIADFDGERWLIAKCDAGLFVAESPGEAAAFDAELVAKISTSAERQRRRAAFASAMRAAPIAQLPMALAS